LGGKGEKVVRIGDHLLKMLIVRREEISAVSGHTLLHSKNLQREK
jgi:hypothetical protein